MCQTNIQELNVDCCEELFDWLTLRELKALRQTCKRLKTVVDYHIQSALLVYSDMSLKDLPKFNASFRQLYKSLRVTCYSGDDMIAVIKPILKGVEEVRIYEVPTEVDSNKDFLPLCTNLKYLEMTNPRSNKWLQYKLPTFEHLSVLNSSIFPLLELQTFFKLNPNIRRFFTGANCVIANENWLMKSNIHLDELGIKCFDRVNIPNICRLLNALFERGFYRRLNLYLNENFDASFLNLVASLEGLDKLLMDENWWINFVKTPMPQIKELCLSSYLETRGPLEELVESCVNIEKINIVWTDFDYLTPLIRHSDKLKQIKVQNLFDDKIYCRNGIINLPALNKERMKCDCASKVTIYVAEELYVKTKEKFMRASFSLIELKQAESIKWNEEFEF